MTALTPLVAATTTARPCSTARRRDICSCCAVSPPRPFLPAPPAAPARPPPAAVASPPLVGGVVGLHHEQTSSPVDGFANDAVVGDLEADDVGEANAGGVQHAGSVPRCEVLGDHAEPTRDRGQDRPEGQVLAKRDEVALDVALPRS